MPPSLARYSVSMVLPMFNEEETIEHALAVGVEALSRHADDWELVVVDDASTDGSPAMVAAAAIAEPRIRLLRHAKNRKLGGTLRTGFAACTKDLVLYMDADLPFDPDVLGHAARALHVSRADLIAGYRLDRTTEGLLRTVYSYGYNTLIGLLFGWPHRDVNFSFKLVRREVLEAIELRAEGSLIDAELIVKARNLGFVIQQLGLDYFPRTRGRSTLSSPSVILKIFAELWKLFPEMRRPRRRQPAAEAAVTGAATSEVAAVRGAAARGGSSAATRPQAASSVTPS
ncbi:MAG TPA: glycosyltransferase family 2 protein [Thermoanaerobaculia bacterium]|nr:glycosyltransferase family 2 protein [Thermoanaerobaculia bacterium]